MTRSSTNVTLRAQLTCALPVSYTCNRPVDINKSRSKFISRCHRVASGYSPHSETLNGNCRPVSIWVDGGGISLGRYPWHIASARIIFTKRLSSSSRRPWARERRQRSVRSGREIFSSLHRRCYGAGTYKGYSCETTCD